MAQPEPPLNLGVDDLPDVQTTCHECGLHVVVSPFEYRLTSSALLCQHQPWDRCRALMLPQARLPDSER
jgi:hypothetical protein